MDKATIKPNEELLPEMQALQRSIAVCLLSAQAKHAQMNNRFGTFELALTIAQLQQAKVCCDEVIHRLGYKQAK